MPKVELFTKETVIFMNKKTTNSLVAVLNIISIVAYFIFFYSTSYLMSSIMTGETGGKSVYNSIIIDTLLNKIHIILTLMFCGIGIINIIGAIQNKENKKIAFWQLVFGIDYLYTGLNIAISFTDIDEDITDWISRIIFSIVPIILAFINFIKIRKNRPKVIQIISYIVVIILSVLSLLEIISTYWQIIAVVMQLIYIHYQEKDIVESKSRRVINILLYYILQLILAIGFLGMVLSSLVITKINETKWKNELEELYNNISTIQGVTNEELYIPVEKNYKYGFINEKGQEKIPCEYDRVSFFKEVETNNSKFYVALAKKDAKFYILSKSNDVLVIDNALGEYLQTTYEHMDETWTGTLKTYGDNRVGYLNVFDFIFSAINVQKEVKINTQMIYLNNDIKEISLTERNSKYYYNNENYSMLIEHIYDSSEEEEDYYNNYREDDYYNEDMDDSSLYETKYKVTISKSNGEIQSSIVHLPGIEEDEEQSTLETFTNGYFEFKNEDGTRRGWYNYKGNQVSVPSKYKITDIKEDKVILQLDNYDEENYDENKKIELNFIILDMTGKILLETTALDIYDNMYLVKNNNKKMVLLDKDLNAITKEYDKIITNGSMDISANHCSYY